MLNLDLGLVLAQLMLVLHFERTLFKGKRLFCCFVHSILSTDQNLVFVV